MGAIHHMCWKLRNTIQLMMEMIRRRAGGGERAVGAKMGRSLQAAARTMRVVLDMVWTGFGWQVSIPV